MHVMRTANNFASLQNLYVLYRCSDAALFVCYIEYCKKGDILMLYVGNKGTHELLLQDNKGRFYSVCLKDGKLTVSRQKTPILSEYKVSLVPIPELECRYHEGGGEPYLFDVLREGDIRDVGTENNAFAYHSGWATFCPFLDGYHVDDMYSVVKATSLPGWEWTHYTDGSGSLRSPSGEYYFCYDMAILPSNMVEYKKQESSAWEYFQANENMKGSILDQFKAFAESWVRENIF